MKPEDQVVFEEWWSTANTRLTDIPKAQAVYIYESMLAHRDKQAAQAESVAVERYLWIFEDKHGDKFVQPNVYYTETEAIESSKICGNKSIGKASESPIICWELKNTQAPAVAVNEQLYKALRHLYHNAKKSGAEMGIALDVAEAAIAAAEAAKGGV